MVRRPTARPIVPDPLLEPRLAATEIRRNAARGVRAITFSEIPAYLGWPSIHDKGRDWIRCSPPVRRRHRHLHAHRLRVEDAIDLR